MSNNFADYKPETEEKIEDKDYKAFIENAEEKTSRAGNPMIVLTIRILPLKIAIKDFFVKNDFFNKNITRMFDCFGIERGDFEFAGWKNAVGGVHVIRNADGFLRIGKYLSKDKQAEIKYDGELPKREVIQKMQPVDEDLPF